MHSFKERKEKFKSDLKGQFFHIEGHDYLKELPEEVMEAQTILMDKTFEKLLEQERRRGIWANGISVGWYHGWISVVWVSWSARSRFYAV